MVGPKRWPGPAEDPVDTTRALPRALVDYIFHLDACVWEKRFWR